MPQLHHALHRGAIPPRDGAPSGPGLIAEGRLPAAVLAGPAHHDDGKSVGRFDDGQHRVGRIHCTTLLDVEHAILLAKSPERKTGVLEDELLHLLLAVTVA